MSNFTFGVSREERQRRYNAAPHVQRSQSLHYRVSDFDDDPILYRAGRSTRGMRGAELTQRLYGFYPPSSRDYSRRRSNYDAHVQPYYHRQAMRGVPDSAARHRLRVGRQRARERSRQFWEANQFRPINDRYGTNIH